MEGGPDPHERKRSILFYRGGQPVFFFKESYKFSKVPWGPTFFQWVQLFPEEVGVQLFIPKGTYITYDFQGRVVWTPKLPSGSARWIPRTENDQDRHDIFSVYATSFETSFENVVGRKQNDNPNFDLAIQTI